MKFKKYAARLVPALLAVALVVCLAVPARAASVVESDRVIELYDYLSGKVYNEDSVTVTFTIDDTIAYSEFSYYDMFGVLSYTNTWERNTIYPILINQECYSWYSYSYILGVLDHNGNKPMVIDLSDIKGGSSIEVVFWMDYFEEQYEMGIDDASVIEIFFINDDGEVDEITSGEISSIHEGDTLYTFEFRFVVPEDAHYMYVAFDTGMKGCDQSSYEYTGIFQGVSLETDLSSFQENSYTLNQITSQLDSIADKQDQTNEKLDGIQDAIGDTNDKLDGIQDSMDQANDTLEDILTGGDAGQDLIDGGDKIEDAGADLGDDIGQIQDFEDQYFGEFEDNLDDIIGATDITFLYPALSFVQYYLNKIVAGVPSQYMVIFTLPALLGIFMYIVGHPIRAPRPDTSGDTVTRETFTETTVLSGPHAGKTTSTRTVTTSQEIGRVHNE